MRQSCPVLGVASRSEEVSAEADPGACAAEQDGERWAARYALRDGNCGRPRVVVGATDRWNDVARVTGMV